jgi:hypothetical protein
VDFDTNKMSYYLFRTGTNSGSQFSNVFEASGKVSFNSPSDVDKWLNGSK